MLGFVYWGNIYYIPLYLQNVLSYDPVVSGALLIPLVATQGIGSIVGGRLISSTGHYNPVLITSQLLWAPGAGLQILYNRTTPIWQIVVFGFLQGIGVGGAFQRKFSQRLVDPVTDRYAASLVALLAHSKKADRAVVNSLRNFLRTLGGAVGLTGKSPIYGRREREVY